MRSIPAALLREAGVDTAKSFDEIKRCVISYFDDSEDQRLKKMLQLGSLGDIKPSAVLRRLREMAPGISDRLVRVRLMDVLPENVRIVLAPLSDPLEKLAESADSIYGQLPIAAGISQPLPSIRTDVT